MKTIKRIIYLLAIVAIVGVFYKYNAFDTIKTKLLGYKNGLIALQSDGSLITDKDLSGLKDSKITGEDYTFDPTFNPYFTMLNDNQKKLYKQVYANAIELSTTFVPITNINIKDVQDVIESIYNDHPELFWLDTNYNYKYLQNGRCVQIILSFNDTINNFNNNKALFENNAQSIIDNANKLSTDYEKEKYVHDELIKLIDYDQNSKINQSAYSGLVNKKTVCAGYARSFQYIMNKLGIPTYFVVGYAKEDHGWNMVKLDDGYYNVDLTWDDSNSISYNYFNKTDNAFSNHTRTGLSLNLPACNATTYQYKEKNNNKKQTIIIKREEERRETPKESQSSIKDNNEQEMIESSMVEENKIVEDRIEDR